jgi:acetyl esterase/lipase
MFNPGSETIKLKVYARMKLGAVPDCATPCATTWLGPTRRKQPCFVWPSLNAGRKLGTRSATAAFFLLFALAVTGCAEEFDVQKNLSYDSTIGYQGTFDFYEPKADSSRTNRPAILTIHGGAWRSGDKAWGETFAKELCPFGYVVFSINYRLSSRPNGTWPAQIEDVQKALKYIRANAGKFRIDPNRIASLGMSAGGHLATMVALRDDPAGPGGRVNTVINLDGEHDMTMPPEQVMADFDNILTALLGHPAPWSDAELRDISTVTFARPDVALLTVHGAGDDNVYVTQGERITAELRSRGAETEFIRVDGKAGNCHEDCWKVDRARKAFHRFLDRKLYHDGNQFFEEKHGKRSPLRD